MCLNCFFEGTTEVAASVGGESLATSPRDDFQACAKASLDRVEFPLGQEAPTLRLSSCLRQAQARHRVVFQYGHRAQYL